MENRYMTTAAMAVDSRDLKFLKCFYPFEHSNAPCSQLLDFSKKEFSYLEEVFTALFW